MENSLNSPVFDELKNFFFNSDLSEVLIQEFVIFVSFLNINVTFIFDAVNVVVIR